MTEHRLLSEEDVYELLAFLVSSAQLLVDEPRLYGPFRLIDAGSRLLGLVLERGGTESEFLSSFKRHLDASKMLAISDEKAFVEFLNDSSRRLARELRRRASPDG